MLTLMKILSTESRRVMVLIVSKVFHVFSWCAGFPDHTELMVMHHMISNMIKPTFINSNYSKLKIMVAYWSCRFNLVLRGSDHVVAQETEGEVVIRSDNAGEGRHYSDPIKQVLNYLWSFHFKL